MKNIILPILLLFVFIVLAVSSMLQKSGTCDEIAHHIPAGVIFLTKGDLKMDTSQPPLSRYIVAAPVVFLLKPHMPDDRQQWRREDRGAFGRDFFFKYNNQARKMLFVSRLIIVLIGVLCAVVLFIWSRQLYGGLTALLSLFLYCFSPNILAHSRLATTDMVATFFILLSFYTFWRFVNNSNTKNLILSGICLGLAQLSKYSTLILYPIFLILFTIALPKIERIRGKEIFLKILLVFLISIIVVWAGYGFRAEPILKDTLRAEEKLEFINTKAEGLLPFWDAKLESKLENFLISFPMPLGEYIIGVLGTLRHSCEGHPTYFLGRWSSKGNILYFIIAFLIKTPIPTLLFLLTGLFISIKKKLSINEYFLILPAFIYFMVALPTNLQIGLRHILPIYPFCIIIAARSVYLLRYRFFKFIIPAFCLWYLFCSLSIWPNYLSYFNEFIGGPRNGWKYLRDSNIDWGQDLPALSKYMAENDIKEITLEYFGQDNPAAYGINFKKFKENELQQPEDKVYAISAHYLEHIYWSKNYAPAVTAGYSMFIYDFRKN